jgi:hypothetical protein
MLMPFLSDSSRTSRIPSIFLSVKQIAPKIIIPFYKKPDQLKEFLKEMEQKAESEEKLVIKKKELPTSTKTVVLKA